MTCTQITYPSYFDSNVTINREQWAVTMICNSESSDRQVFFQAFSSSTNHAILVLESIKKTGALLRQIVHFTGPNLTKQPNDVIFQGSWCFLGKLRVGNVLITNHKEVVDFTHKSKTWVCSAEKVRTLRRDAKRERDNPFAFPRPFSILGNRSIFTRNLNTYKITDPLVSVIAKADPMLFRELYDLAKAIKKNQKYWIEGEGGGENLCPLSSLGSYYLCTYGNDTILRLYYGIDPCGFKLPQPGLVYNFFFPWKDRIPKNRLKEIERSLAHTHTGQDRQNLMRHYLGYEREFLCLLVKDLNDRLFNQFPRIMGSYVGRLKAAFATLEHAPDFPIRLCVFDRGLEDCEDFIKLLYLIHTKADLCPLTPDSCFTWAREKLALIDVKIPDTGVEYLLSSTKMYLTPANRV